MVKVCSRSELPPENATRQYRLASGKMLCVANVGGRLYAMDDMCPHQGASLGQGTVERGLVVCPWHGWQIDPRTGVAKQDAECRVQRYAVEVHGEDVVVRPISE
jgi:nitrite reductase/ring-hydroxylating ferredoxin subunit